jgi:hypothetical protein
MRVCAFCETSLDGYRRDARFCGAGCRSAARHSRRAERSDSGEPKVPGIARCEPAQSRAETCSERLATTEEETEVKRLLRKVREWEDAAA